MVITVELNFYKKNRGVSLFISKFLDSLSGIKNKLLDMKNGLLINNHSFQNPHSSLAQLFNAIESLLKKIDEVLLRNKEKEQVALERDISAHNTALLAQNLKDEDARRQQLEQERLRKNQEEFFGKIREAFNLLERQASLHSEMATAQVEIQEAEVELARLQDTSHVEESPISVEAHDTQLLERSAVAEPVVVPVAQVRPVTPINPFSIQQQRHSTAVRRMQELTEESRVLSELFDAILSNLKTSQFASSSTATVMLSALFSKQIDFRNTHFIAESNTNTPESQKSRNTTPLSTTPSPFKR